MSHNDAQRREIPMKITVKSYDVYSDSFVVTVDDQRLVVNVDGDPQRVTSKDAATNAFLLHIGEDLIQVLCHEITDWFDENV
jgi:very-short-patch-repair endonuclease